MEERRDVFVTNDDLVYRGFRFESAKDLEVFKNTIKRTSDVFMKTFHERKEDGKGFVSEFKNLLKYAYPEIGDEYGYSSVKIIETVGAFLHYFGDPAFLEGPLKYETKKVYTQICREMIGSELEPSEISNRLTPLILDDRDTIKETYDHVLEGDSVLSKIDDAFKIKAEEE